MLVYTGIPNRSKSDSGAEVALVVARKPTVVATVTIVIGSLRFSASSIVSPLVAHCSTVRPSIRSIAFKLTLNVGVIRLIKLGMFNNRG